jgi:hypothetical protein
VLALAAATALMLPTATPGARYYKVAQATISKTICVTGWTETIRPPESYTTTLKKMQLAAWHDADQDPAHHEEDHLISLELGGAPRSTKNRSTEHWSQAHKSDPRKNAWRRKVCNGTLTPRQARKLELAYKRAHGWLPARSSSLRYPGGKEGLEHKIHRVKASAWEVKPGGLAQKTTGLVIWEEREGRPAPQ